MSRWSPIRSKNGLCGLWLERRFSAGALPCPVFTREQCVIERRADSIAGSTDFDTGDRVRKHIEIFWRVHYRIRAMCCGLSTMHVNVEFLLTVVESQHGPYTQAPGFGHPCGDWRRLGIIGKQSHK